MTAEQKLAIDTLVSRTGDIKAVSYSEILGFDWRPEWRGGVIRVSGQIVDNPAAIGISYQFAIVDVRIVSLVGSGGLTLLRAALGKGTADIELVLSREAAYKRISVLARVVIDGDVGKSLDSSTGPTQASCQAIARMDRA